MKLIIIVLATLTSLTTSAQVHCKATTKSGKPCTSVIVNKTTGYCNAHNPGRKHCKAVNSLGKPCGMMPVKGGDYCRFHVKNRES